MHCIKDGISIEYNGHSVIKLHVFHRKNAATEIWNRIQTKALKGLVHFTYGISTDRKQQKHDTGRGQQTRNISLRVNRCNKSNFRRCLIQTCKFCN
jgi:hypothetical protein